jgi:divalent metal cation (Fe/Co/Zn/Cd) transporter
LPLLLLQEEKEILAKSETFAIRISNFANMVLFVAKTYASIKSGSLAIIASTLDSLLDLLSGFILWFTAFSMQTPNPYQYPIGKKRMQPLVSPLSIMLSISGQIFQYECNKLHHDLDAVSLLSFFFLFCFIIAICLNNRLTVDIFLFSAYEYGSLSNEIIDFPNL